VAKGCRQSSPLGGERAPVFLIYLQRTVRGEVPLQSPDSSTKAAKKKKVPVTPIFKVEKRVKRATPARRFPPKGRRDFGSALANYLGRATHNKLQEKLIWSAAWIAREKKKEGFLLRIGGDGRTKKKGPG